MTDEHVSPDQDATAKVAELIRDIETCMMTTVDDEGNLVARPMTTQEVDDEGAVWFIAQRSNAQVRSIEARPKVNLAYASRGAWVSVSGEASVVDDVDRLRGYWGPTVDVWAEGGPEHPDNILVRVDAHTAEYWGGGGAAGAMTTLVSYVKARLTGGRPSMDHDTVDMG